MIVALLFIFILLQVADCYTTIRILGQGGRELNPVLVWLFTKASIPEVLVIIKAIAVCILLVFAKLADPVLTLWVLGFADVLYTGVVGWNSYQLFKK